MRITVWAAVAVTILMGLANLGLIAQHHLGLKIAGLALAVAAGVAAAGLVTRRAWGAIAAIALGVVNLVGAVLGAFLGADGWAVGVVLGGLAIVLAFLARPNTTRS